MGIIERIEDTNLLYIFILTFIFSFLFDKSLSFLVGGIFMFGSFHLLKNVFKGFPHKASPTKCIFKFLLRSVAFYVILVLLLLNQTVIDPLFFLFGTTTLSLSILTASFISREE